MPEARFETVAAYVGHRTGTSSTREGPEQDITHTITTHYDVTHVQIRRPISGIGQVSTRVRCDTCGKELRYIGYSPARARLRRVRQVLNGCGLILLAAAGWSFTGWKGAQYGNAPVGAGAGWLFTGVVIAGGLLVWYGIKLIRSDRDPGVRLRGDRRHSHREYGSSYDEYVSGGNRPMPY